MEQKDYLAQLRKETEAKVGVYRSFEKQREALKPQFAKRREALKRDYRKQKSRLTANMKGVARQIAEGNRMLAANKLNPVDFDGKAD
jgi:hypothetical protein